jgi:hypothetical protein
LPIFALRLHSTLKACLRQSAATGFVSAFSAQYAFGLKGLMTMRFFEWLTGRTGVDLSEALRRCEEKCKVLQNEVQGAQEIAGTASVEAHRLADNLDSMTEDRDKWRQRSDAKDTQLALLIQRYENLQEGALMIAEREGVSVDEIIQLGLAVGHGQPGNVATVPFNPNDPAHVLLGDVSGKATEAKFRNLKAAFRNHKLGVEALLAEMDDLGKRNHLSREDYRKLRSVRDRLRSYIAGTPTGVDTNNLGRVAGKVLAKGAKQ